MTNLRHSDITGGKKIGDQWHSVMAPEEYHTWDKKYPWSSDKFKEYGVGFVRAFIKSTKAMGKSNNMSFDKKSPLILRNGIEIQKGSTGLNSGVKYWKGLIPADGILEFNQSMNYICEMSELEFFTISNLVVYRKDKGCEIEFKIHNPDSTGSQLYLWRAWFGGNDLLYDKINFFEQQRICGDFYEKKRVAGCELIEGGPVVKCTLLHAKDIKNLK